jgi:hypothetical protein
MAKWQRVLDLLPEYEAFQEDSDAAYDETKLAALAGVVATRLKALEPFGEPNADLDSDRDDLVSDFEDFQQNPGSVEEFNSLMAELYDWADTPLDNEFAGKKACWVKTF